MLKHKLTALADPVQVVEVAADVVPEPGSATVEDDAVLLAVVVVGLVLAPAGLENHLAWGDTNEVIIIVVHDASHRSGG